MPLIYEIRCDACRYRQRATGSLVAVLTRDGREVTCPHPREIRTAEEVTGESWRELEEQGRLLRREAHFCRGCGEVSYVLGSEHDCTRCGAASSLLPLWIFDQDPFGRLLRWLKILPPTARPSCPWCSSGRLWREAVAVS